MNGELRKKIDHKNNLYKKSVLKPTSKNKIAYKNYRNELRKEIKKVEENYYVSIIEMEKNNLKTMWDTIGMIINPNKMKQNNCIKELRHNSKVAKSDNDIAKLLNNHFSTVGENLAKNFAKSTDYKKYLGTSNSHSFFLAPVTVQDTLKEIRKLKDNKASGDDGIKPKIIKSMENTFAGKITHLINLSFQNGNVPKKIKNSKSNTYLQKE